MRRVVMLLLACALSPGSTAVALAQSQATTGTIEGIVSDTTGAVLPGATVTLVHGPTGFTRAVTTDDGGRYRGVALPLGAYTITVERDGFTKATRENVELAVGQTLRIDFPLTVAGVSQEISVTAGSPVIEVTRSEQAALIDERSVANLPINGRNFIDFVKLAPTVAIVQGPDGAEISINGQRGIYNNVMIDGADANNPFFGEQRGGQRPKYIISLEAVKEFQVVTDGASAEFGRSAGGFVNMVTKSGTNRVLGTGFYFGRYGALLSENSDGTKDDDFSQHQFGGSLGGPIRRDRAFFFVSWDQNEEQRVKSKAAFDDPAINPSGEGRRLLNILASRFNARNEGGAENPMPQTNDARVFLGKLDTRVGAAHHASARYAYSWAQQINGTFDVPTWTASANGIEQDRSHSIVGQMHSMFGAMVNEAKVQYAREPRPRPYAGPDLPDTAIGNFPAGQDRSFRFGRPFFLPINDATDQRFQAANNTTIVKGRHLLKFGGEVNWTSMTQVFVGFARGRYIFTGGMPQFEAFLNNPTSSAALSSFVLYLQRVPLGGRSIDDSGRQDIPVWEPAFFIQDKWSLRPNVTLNAGLRWEGYNSPGALTPPSQTPYAQYFTDPRFPTNTGEIPDDWSGWQPRVGLTWDPKRNGRTVIRGTAGLFKARTPSLVWANPRTANGVIFANYVGVIVPGFNFGVPTFPNLVDTRNFVNVNPGVAVVDRNFKNPESRQASISVEREVARNLAVGAAYNYAKTRFLSRFTDPNVDRGAYARNAEGRPIYAGGNASPGRPFPTLGQVLTTESTGRSQYNALVLTLNKKYSNRWQAQANWVVSEDKSDDDNERDPFTVRYADLFDLESEYSLSDRHSRNRANVFGVFDLPRGFQFTALLQYRSPQPTTGSDALTADADFSNDDANLDGYTNDRRFVNGRDVGRNKQEKDNEFFTLDLRVSKLFRMRRQSSVELLFEVFNLTNSKNNLVSQISGGLLFDFSGTIRSGVGDPRQAQLGIRMRF